MGDHPVAWYHEFDGGRSFYTGLRHTKESYSDELFLQHLLAGIEYAIGSSPRPDYSASRTSPLPEENRFTKTQLILGELRSEEHTSELQSRGQLVCRLLLEKKKKKPR